LNNLPAGPNLKLYENDKKMLEEMQAMSLQDFEKKKLEDLL